MVTLSPADASLKRLPRQSVALLAILVAMISLQAGASLAKQLFPLLGARGASALRLVLAALLLSALHRPWRQALTWRQGRAILLYGATLGVMNLSFYLALARIPLGVAVSLEFTGPLAVALLASHHLRDVFWAIWAAGGILLIVGRGLQTSSLDALGVVLALVAGACWALYIVFGQRVGTIVSSRMATTFGMIIAACVVLPASLIQSEPMTLTPAALGLGLVVAILSSALPYSLEMVALQRLPTKTFGICMSLDPAIGAFLGMMLLREHLLPSQWLGIACVMGASIASVATSAADAAHPPPTPEIAM